jgi:23S rRNA (cytidine1920-2'-O)/16S rRNA (cytidine1409-2'-O)-methyltransferase
VRRARLDAELVRRGLARSRDHAQELIGAGLVSVGGITATKAASQVGLETSVRVDEPSGTTYVSRGGHKLASALDVFSGVGVVGRRVLDAGASTGGFTDVLLRRGAREVVAVDVGYGQLAWALRGDPRVVVLDRTNVRTLSLEQVPGGPVDLVVADLSFISLALVLPALIGVAAPDADLVLMVKPQFEVGRERLGSGGVVREAALRSEAVRTIAERAAALGWGTVGVTASPLPGPAGNVEYFVWLRAGAPPPDPRSIDRAVSEGPT